ncbi:MAG: thermosome subunit beta [Thermoprotei archaeon]|jgi:thermosome
MVSVPSGGTSTVPVLILKEGTQRTTGYDALRANITAAMAVAETVKSSLGPRGMDKMLIDTIGDITITNDGATILNEIEVQHPAAKLLVQIAKTQDDEVGDGTTTSVVIAGQLLKEAEELIDKNVHPTVIVSGYRKAEIRAREIIDSLAIKVNIDDDEMLKKVALTSIHGKSVSSVKEHLADICVKAVKAITEERNGKRVADINKIQLIKKQGGGLLDTALVYGVIVDKEVVHPGMPKKVTNAKIALIDAPLEIEKTEIDAEIRISNPEQMKAFLDEEERMLKNMVEKIKSVGANVVFCQKGIDDIAQHYLAKAGILAVRRVKKSDMEKLALATGGKIVTNIEDLTSEDLGEAALVEERRVAGDKMVFVEGCKNPKSVSILIRGGLERLVDEAERSIIDALSVVSDVIEDPRVVYGGGAIEVEISKALRKYASTVGGREQLAIEAFAKGVEAIPRALAENAGGDPIDALAELKSVHEQGKVSYGINGFTGKIDDMEKQGVIEPASVKIQAISSATEAAATILRIDDIIAASKISKAEKGPEKEKKEEEEKD